MAREQNSRSKRRIGWLPVLFIVVVAGLLLTVGGFAFAANQETHDAFCASCHTQPETTFYQRSTGGAPVDLASYHTTQKTLCINCHSGPGVAGRVQAELVGARNAVLWYTGQAVQPAKLTYPISDQNCLKCHQDVTQRGFTPKEQIQVPGRAGGFEGEGEGEGRNNHWHQFMVRWQAATPTAGTCVSCHSSHATGGTAQTGFMQAEVVQTQCNACHKVLRREGE